MQEIKKRLGLCDVLILITFASLSFMVIPAWIPFLRKGWALLAIASVIIVFKWRTYICPQSFLALLVYDIIAFFNVLTGDVYFGSFTYVIYEFLLLFVPSSVALYCTKGGNESFVRALVCLTFMALVFEMTASYKVLNSNPGIVRSLYLTSQVEGGLVFMYSFFKLGILDYSMGHALPILIAPIFCLFKEGTRIEKIICLFLVAVCVTLVWMSESATAILLMVFMIALGFIVNGRRSFRRNVIIVFVAMMLAAGMMSNAAMSVLFDVSISSLGDDSIFGDRLGDLQMSLYEDQLSGDLEGRVNLYQQSVNVLSGSNILFGGNQMPGRHSGILDRFASLGLVGFIPLALFFFYSLRAIIQDLPENRRIYYIECIIAAMLMLFFKGLWVWPIFLFLFVISPCILIMKQDKQ